MNTSPSSSETPKNVDIDTIIEFFFDDEFFNDTAPRDYLKAEAKAQILTLLDKEYQRGLQDGQL